MYKEAKQKQRNRTLSLLVVDFHSRILKTHNIELEIDNFEKGQAKEIFS